MQNPIVKIIFLISAFFLVNLKAIGQLEEIYQLQQLYVTTDSVIALNRPFQMTEAFAHDLDSLNKQHPSQYFGAVNNFIQANQWDQAAFVYHLGVLRYSFYNLCKKDYKASDDGALFGSLKYATGELVGIYLKGSVEKYIEILKAVDYYVIANEYDFQPTKKHKKEYEELNYHALIEDLKTNWQQYELDWKEERRQIQEGMAKMMEEYNKLTEEEKQQLKK